MYIFEVRTTNESGNDPNTYLENLMAYYSFPKEKINILKSVKLKQQDVSSEVLVTAIDVKCNFTKQINANQGKMLNKVTELLEADWKLDTSKAFNQKNKLYDSTLKFQDFLTEKK